MVHSLVKERNNNTNKKGKENKEGGKKNEKKERNCFGFLFFHQMRKAGKILHKKI